MQNFQLDESIIPIKLPQSKFCLSVNQRTKFEGRNQIMNKVKMCGEIVDRKRWIERKNQKIDKMSIN